MGCGAGLSAANHRLLTADGLAIRIRISAAIEFYTPDELRDLARQPPTQRPSTLDLLPVIALGGLGGLRLQEVARLTWEDVFRVEGTSKFPGQEQDPARRLVTTCHALAHWLATYLTVLGPMWPTDLENFHDGFRRLAHSTERSETPPRTDCATPFAPTTSPCTPNENLTAALAGNSPTMIHAHYKGLATKAEAEKWFKVTPVRPANVVVLKKPASA